MSEFEFIIIKNDKDLIQHEKNLYHRYGLKNPYGWVAQNYQVIDNCRLQSHFPYEDQIVYAIKKNNEVKAACTLMTNQDMPLMLEQMGFRINKENVKIAEGINLYAPDDLPGEEVMQIFGNFFLYMTHDLASKGFDFVYSACERHMKAFYSLMGFEILEKIEIQGMVQCLTRYSLKG
ncbi:MAG: hypothetical protein MJB14_10110 [Spirochaetes bacterium]|nr:hypothetical protein [Spirochaetota bacterium]